MSLSLGLIIATFILIVAAASYYWSPEQRTKRLADQFVDNYQADVIETCLIYAKRELSYPEYKRFQIIFERKIAAGGASLKSVLDSSIEEAREGVDGVDTDH